MNEEVIKANFFRSVKPISRIPPEWPCHDIIVMCLPLSVWDRDNPISFSNINETNNYGRAHKVLLQAILEILENRESEPQAPIAPAAATATGPNIMNPILPTSMFIANGVPRTGIIAEMLIDDNKRFQGYRLFFVKNDQNVRLVDGFKKWVTDNSQNPDKSVRFGCKVSSITGLCSGVFDIYTISKGQLEVNFIRDAEEFENINSRKNPINVLNAKTAIGVNSNSLCKAQSSISNYFNSDVIFDSNTFKRQFPLPEYTFELHGIYFNSYTLYKKWQFLPHITKNALLDTYNRFVQERLTQTEEERPVIHDEDNITTEEMELMDIIDDAAETLRITSIESQSNESEIHLEIMEILKTITDDLLKRGEDNGKARSKNDIKQRSIIEDKVIAMAEENSAIIDEIAKKYPIGTPDHCREMKKFRERTIFSVWTHLIHNPKRTDTHALAAITFLSLEPGDYFHESNMCARNMGLYDNMKISLNSYINKRLRVYKNYNIGKIGLLTSIATFHLHWGPRINIVIAGDSEAGKSFALQQVADHMTMGSILPVSHQTEKYLTGARAISDTVFLFNEMPSYIQGRDRHGKDIGADNLSKTAMTEGFIQTNEYNKNPETGKRESDTVFVRAHVSNIYLTNNASTVDNSWHTRILQFFATKPNSNDAFSNHSFDIGFNERDIVGERLDKMYQRLHLFCFWYQKLQDTNVLPPINTDMCNIVLGFVFEELKKQSIPKPDEKKILFYKDFCRAQTVMYAVYAWGFSELGRKYRIDENGEPLKFDPKWWLDIIPYGYVTERIAIDVLTMMEPVFIPVERAKLVEHLRLNKLNWPPVESSNKVKFMRLFDGKSSTPTGIDKRYVEFTGPSIDSIYNLIRCNGTEAVIASTSIQETIGKLATEKVLSPDYHFSDVNLLDENGEPLLNEKGEQITRSQFVEDPDTKEEIPIVIRDVIPHTRTSRISIACAFISNDLNCSIRNALKALEHSKGKTRTYITSFPVLDEVVDKKTKMKTHKYYHGINDVITLNHKPGKTLIAQNSKGYTKTDLHILSNVTECNTPKISETPNYKLDEDLDVLMMNKYFTENGIEFADDTLVGYPDNATEFAWNLRYDCSSYEKLNESLIMNYPADILDIERKKLQDINEGQTGTDNIENASLMETLCNKNGKRTINIDDMEEGVRHKIIRNAKTLYGRRLVKK